MAAHLRVAADKYAVCHFNLCTVQRWLGFALELLGLLITAVVVIYDDFANFRVWHSDRGSKHPCGAADEGETPWTPPAE